MGSNTFVANRIRALRAPLAGANGRAWATAIGSAQDDELPVLRVAGVSRSLSKAPEDALAPVLGSLYQRTQAPRELYTEASTGAYRTRLGSAWSFWESAPMIGDGSVTGLTSLFNVYADPTHTLASSPRVLNGIQAGTGWYSEVFFVWPSPLTDDGAWSDSPGSDVWDDGGLWDVFYDPANSYAPPSFGAADLAWFRREIRLAKGAQVYPVAICVGLGFDIGGDSPLWDDGSVWDADVAADPDTVWDTFDAPSVVLPLGHLWGENALGYGGAPSAWDASPGDLWDQDGDSYEPPTEAGW